jgi:hypothetical protein
MMEHVIKMQMQILKADDKTLAVEFLRLDGDKTMFMEAYKDFRDNVLKNMNDSLGPSSSEAKNEETKQMEALEIK